LDLEKFDWLFGEQQIIFIAFKKLFGLLNIVQKAANYFCIRCLPFLLRFLNVIIKAEGIFLLEFELLVQNNCLLASYRLHHRQFQLKLVDLPLLYTHAF